MFNVLKNMKVVNVFVKPKIQWVLFIIISREELFIKNIFHKLIIKIDQYYIFLF